MYFWLGAARIGAVSAAVNGASKGDFLSHALRLSQAAVVITDAERQPRLPEVSGDVETLRSVLVQGDSLTRDAGRALRRAAPDVAPAGPDDIGALFFTSGTTGPSKAVATTWPYLFRAADTVAAAWEFGAGDVLWTAMPLFHLSAAPTVLAPMLVGGTSVLADGFHPAQRVGRDTGLRRRGFRRGGRHGVDVVEPAAGSARCRTAVCGSSRRRRSRRTSTATSSERYGCRIVTMYGMTEAFPIAYKAVSEEGVPGTSGRVNPAFDVRIVDSHGKPVPRVRLGRSSAGRGQHMR